MTHAWSNPGEMPAFLLLRTTGVSFAGETLTGGLECAVLELTQPTMKMLFTRAELILTARRQDPAVYEMYWWDSRPVL